MFLTILEITITIVSVVVGILSWRSKEKIRQRVLPTLTKKQAYNWLTLFTLLLWSLAIVMIVLFFYNSKRSFNQTVFVHGSESRQQIIDDVIGHVIIDLDNDRRRLLIGENGKTDFNEIPNKFKGKNVELSVDMPGYCLAIPDASTLS